MCSGKDAMLCGETAGRHETPEREPRVGARPEAMFCSHVLSPSVILSLYIVDFSPCIFPKFVVLGFSSNVMQSTVAPCRECLAGSRCLFSCQNKARRMAEVPRALPARVLCRPCSCDCSDTGVQRRSALAPPLRNVGAFFLGRTGGCTCWFSFSRHFHLYITESHI